MYGVRNVVTRSIAEGGRGCERDIYDLACFDPNRQAGLSRGYPVEHIDYTSRRTTEDRQPALLHARLQLEQYLCEQQRRSDIPSSHLSSETKASDNVSDSNCYPTSTHRLEQSTHTCYVAAALSRQR